MTNSNKRYVIYSEYLGGYKQQPYVDVVSDLENATQYKDLDDAIDYAQKLINECLSCAGEYTVKGVTVGMATATDWTVLELELSTKQIPDLPDLCELEKKAKIERENKEKMRRKTDERTKQAREHVLSRLSSEEKRLLGIH